MSDKCPKCGADRTQKTSLHVKYACGSCDLLERRDLDLPASFLEGVDCKDRQIAALTARVNEAAEAWLHIRGRIAATSEQSVWSAVTKMNKAVGGDE